MEQDLADPMIYGTQHEADKQLAVRFFTMPLKNEGKSLKEGRPIFDDTEMIEIRVRGDRNNVVQRPLRDEDKRRFAAAYSAHVHGQEQLNSGTPLSEWPLASASLVEELKYLGYYTVEQLSQASDSACSRVPGLLSLKQRAKAYIELAAGHSPIARLQAELESSNSEKAALAKQVQDLAARFAELEAQMKGAEKKVPEVNAVAASTKKV